MDSDEEDTIVVIENSQFHNYTSLIDSLYRMNGIHRILELLFKFSRDRQTRYNIMRKNIVTNFILPLILFKLEKTSLINTFSNKSTVDCVRLRIVYGLCKYLFRVPCDLTQFSLLQCDEKSFSLKLFDFDAHDFNFILTSFYHSIISTYYRRFSNKYQWRHKDYTENPLFDPNIILFYIDVHPLLIEIEKKIVTLYGKHVEDNMLNVQIRESDNALEQDLFSKLGDPNSQQYRIILFTPTELKRGLDIDTMKNLSLDNVFYTTSILRESSTNHFFHSRLAGQFCDEIGADNWYKELYFETTNFQNIDKLAIRRRVIIGDCHLLTGEDLLNMMKWLIFYKDRIKEIILIGSVHILPVIQNGQPFLDLLLKINTRQVRSLLGSRETTSSDFKNMIEREWSQMNWVKRDKKRESQIRRYEFLNDPTREERCSVLYHMRGLDDMEDFFHQFFQHINISIIHLYQEKKKIEFNLGKKSLFKITDLKLDNLLHYKKSIIKEKEEFFVISHSLVKSLNKNQLNLIFSTLDKLIILGKEKDEEVEKKLKDIIDEITTIFESDTRPNLRYTYSSTM